VKKITESTLRLSGLRQNALRSVIVISRAQRGQVGQSVIPDLLDQGVTVGRAVSRRFGYELVDDEWDGFNVTSVVELVWQ
jgi:hypothetical protein